MTETTKARTAPTVYIVGYLCGIGVPVFLCYCVFRVSGLEVDTVIFYAVAGILVVCCSWAFGIAVFCRGYYVESFDAHIGKMGPVALGHFLAVFRDLYDSKRRSGMPLQPDIEAWHEQFARKKEEG